MEIVAFDSLDESQLDKAADILRAALDGPSYKGIGEAEAQVLTFLQRPERFALAAVECERVLGWVGGVRGYSHALELHPLVVDPDLQRQGIGSALVSALQDRAIAEGFLTLHLGTDDWVGGTSLSGAPLFPDVLQKLGQVQPQGDGHAYFFYLKLGFEPVGVLPDANGPGLPDILMAKPLVEIASTNS
ncbi:MAG: N-acetyltransferase [Alphaproteobacteria bacterium PA2]|nr:MAG: N-acetyltransferase [Alphaproteobacteria bacterium PA2]